MAEDRGNSCVHVVGAPPDDDNVYIRCLSVPDRNPNLTIILTRGRCPRGASVWSPAQPRVSWWNDLAPSKDCMAVYSVLNTATPYPHSDYSASGRPYVTSSVQSTAQIWTGRVSRLFALVDLGLRLGF